MIPSEAEIDFENWWKSTDEPLFLYSTIAKKAWLEAYSQQQEKIEKLREGIGEVLDGTLPYLTERRLKKLLDET